MENKETFSYTYNASQQEEVKKIREKYTKQQEDKMEMLRRLDKSTTQKSTVVALTVGIIGTLLMGLGMSCTMVWTDTLLIPGIIIGVIGIGILLTAYPLYNLITKREKERVAPEIIRLTDELMKQ